MFWKKNDDEIKDDSNKSAFHIFKRGNDADPIDPEEPLITDNPSFLNFFKLFGRKFNNIVMVNILMIFGNFPIFFFLLGVSGYFSIHTTAPAYTMFAPLSGVMEASHSAASAALFNIYSLQSPVTVLTTVDYALFAASALLIFTIGPVTVGTTYILRNIVRGEPVFMWSDFWQSIKRNIKQAIVFGLIDSGIIFLLVYDTIFFKINSSSNFIMNVMFFGILFLAILYFLMRTYIYTMIVTFDMSFKKLFKNALIFSVIGIKRNILALLGTVLILFANYMILAVYYPLGVILPFTITLSTVAFLTQYCAFPNIKKYMIDPYYESQD